MEKSKKCPLFLFALMAIFFVSNFVNINDVFAFNKVNINTAGSTELDTIPEVGPSTAVKIIAYRETNGPFVVIEDIMKVSGIKEATFAKMKDYITVGGDSTGDNSDSDIATSTSTTTNSENLPVSSSDSNSNSNSFSVHYAQEDLSDYTEPENVFEVSAGRDRLVYVNSPVSFIAKHKLLKDLQSRNCDYFWTFGDGIAMPGEKVEHKYKYQGDYNVVLNGSCNDLHSVSRTTVKVAVPSLAISTNSDGAVEIKNFGKYEINLYGWKIKSLNQSYVFPIDTIVSAGKSIVFPLEYLRITKTKDQIILADASDKEIMRIDSGIALLNNGEVISLDDFEKFSLEYNKLIKKPLGSTQVLSDVSNQNNSAIIPMSASVIDSLLDSTNTEQEEIIEDDPHRGFWSKLFHPIRTIKEAFYK